MLPRILRRVSRSGIILLNPPLPRITMSFPLALERQGTDTAIHSKAASNWKMAASLELERSGSAGDPWYNTPHSTIECTRLVAHSLSSALFSIVGCLCGHYIYVGQALLAAITSSLSCKLSGSNSIVAAIMLSCTTSVWLAFNLLLLQYCYYLRLLSCACSTATHALHLFLFVALSLRSTIK